MVNQTDFGTRFPLVTPEDNLRETRRHLPLRSEDTFDPVSLNCAKLTQIPRLNDMDS